MKFKLITDHLLIHIESSWWVPVFFILMYVILYYGLHKYSKSLKENQSDQ